MTKAHTPVTPPTPAPRVPRASTPQIPDGLRLDKRLYGRYMRLLEVLGRRTDIRVKTAEDNDALASGDIFLFNHFTRFETVVPPYIIFRQTGQLTRSVGHHGLFEVNDVLSRILRETGGVPNNIPRLLPFLTEEIIRGRKVVLFPEGGMIKDKHVLDGRGRYSVYSPSNGINRPHHRGAAVLALMTELAKRHILAQFEAKDTVTVDQWCKQLGMTPDALLASVRKPTLIVPGNITFYPIRTGRNLLVKAVEGLFGEAGMQALDELTIESNLIFRHTDMDIRFGAPMAALPVAHLSRDQALAEAMKHATTVDEIFALHDDGKGRAHRHAKALVDAEIDRIRGEYAFRIYRETTVNLNHLAATLVTILAERGRMEIGCGDFHKTLYTALKALQQDPRAHLHCSITRPANYAGLLDGTTKGLRGFMATCAKAKLVKRYGSVYRLSHRLQDVYEFQEIRLENPVRMHANEVAPLPYVRRALEKALDGLASTSDRDLALNLFDDQMRDYYGQRTRWGKKAPGSMISATAADTHAPYLLLPTKPAKTGVLLVHGFGTSPAELRDFGAHLHAHGHAVLGMRLPGHGTSWLDMETRSRADWLAAVRGHISILSALCERVVVIGFSTGGALALLAAAEPQPKLAGVAAVAAPVVVSDKNINYLKYAAVVHHAIRWLPGLRNVLRLYPYGTQTPDTVYKFVPVDGLNQLRLLIAELLKNLKNVTLPVLVVQGLSDKTVIAKSAAEIFTRLGSETKELKWVAGGPHNLITGNYGPTWELLRGFVSTCAKKGKKL